MITYSEAMNAADYACRTCEAKEAGICTRNPEDCWIYHARVALFYRTPAEPIVKGYIDTPRGKTERLYCSNCNKPIKNNNRYKFCSHCGKAIDWSV